MPQQMPDQSCICNLHNGSWQHQILNPLSKARDQTCVLMDTSQIHFHWAMMRTPQKFHFIYLFLFFIIIFFLSFVFSKSAPMAYGSSQARGQIGAVAAGLRQSDSNTGSEPRLQPTPQLTATQDPQPTERGQGTNLHPHGYSSGS